MSLCGCPAGGTGAEETDLVTSTWQREWTPEKYMCALSLFLSSPTSPLWFPNLWAAPILSTLQVMRVPSLLFLSSSAPALRVPYRWALLDSSQISPLENAMCFLLGPRVITKDLMMKLPKRGRERGGGEQSLKSNKAGDTLNGGRQEGSPSPQGAQFGEQTGSE